MSHLSHADGCNDTHTECFVHPDSEAEDGCHVWPFYTGWLVFPDDEETNPPGDSVTKGGYHIWVYCKCRNAMAAIYSVWHHKLQANVPCSLD